jgi:dTDP-4-dehydrorhamnose 3,5-epimerase
MNVIPTSIADVKIIEPKVFGDERGFFYESFNQDSFQSLTGLDVNFVQDNHSKSRQGVLRGLHYQIRQAQGKLVRVVKGEVYDVVVDLRQSSPTFAQWEGIILSEQNFRQLWVPVGFAHGFLVLSKTAEFLYKTTDFYAPEHERCIKWDDSKLSVDWPSGDFEIQVSAKDQQGKAFSDAEYFA